MVVGIREVKNNASKLVDAVRHGEEVILTNRDERVAKLVPSPKAFPKGRGRDFLKGKVNLYPSWDSPEESESKRCLNISANRIAIEAVARHQRVPAMDARPISSSAWVRSQQANTVVNIVTPGRWRSSTCSALASLTLRQPLNRRRPLRCPLHSSTWSTSLLPTFTNHREPFDRLSIAQAFPKI
jgi:prevent-host-death family protein